MINLDIEKYIQANILPKYNSFDKGHLIDHAETVISNSLKIAVEYNVNIDMVYVIAAYHDTGLALGRKDHEKNSALALLADCKLQKWFSSEELAIMAEAVEDHRASNNYEPRSIYGKIISEADRNIDYITILTRTIHYSISNYPNYTAEQHYRRSIEHIKEKYCDGGYLTLWLDTELNKSKLAELRNAVADEARFNADFAALFEECKKEYN